MSRISNRLLAAAYLSAALFFIEGCILNPETDKKPPPPVEIDWPELYEKEDVIETISLCYKYYNRVSKIELEEKYTNILYQGEGEEYVFYYQPDDVPVGGDPFMTLAEDVEGSMYVWNNATALVLSLDPSPGSWQPYTDICDECYLTTRQYTITTTIDHHGELVPLSGVGMYVDFIIRPHHDDPDKWAIFIVYDRPAG
ncbi:MAG: hypothetical protein JW814_04820 [Candidatus Krumholzibacteriota bacterium]|nr:hypothetical protein [Candidatus Krumholzibacteriota bacterium]